MTNHEHTALQQLALNALANRAGPGAGAAAVAAAAQRAYDELVLVAIPLIGRVGVDALTGRTLYLAQRQYRWLAQSPEPDQWKGPFAQVVFCLERQQPTVAMEAAGAVLATLTELMVTFIGNSLTVRMLQEAWPDAFSEASSGRHEA